MRKDFKSTFSRKLVACGQHCPARAEHHESVFLASFMRFPGVAASIALRPQLILLYNLIIPLHYPVLYMMNLAFF